MAHPATGQASSASRLPWRGIALWGTIAAVMVSFALSLQWWLSGMKPELWPQFLTELPIWLTFALLTPAIFAASRRYPLESGRWPLSLFVHLAIAPAVSFVVVAIAALVWSAVGLEQGYTATVDKAFRSTFAAFSVIYFGIVALHHSLAYRSAYLEKTERQLRAEAEASRARLEAVQAQLQPHFLFNTLNTISSLVTRDPRTARTMIVHLSDLLRTVLRRAPLHQVPLADELRFAESYLEIQRLRFRDRLEVSIEADPAVLDCPVPPMLLQPILENALQHGMPETGPARVVVRAWRHDDAIRIAVLDDGPGFGTQPVRKGHGLSSVDLLLEAQHGPDYRLSFEERLDGGGCVVVDLPQTHSSISQGA